MVEELTEIQEAFLSDLRASGSIILSMTKIQDKYSDIASKASIKRNIEALVNSGIVKRNNYKINHNGKITSTTIYKL